MKLELTLRMDNATFADGNSGFEAARILRKVANRLDGLTLDEDCGTCNDHNGNKVCCWTISND